jgi:hypothetical protein
MVQFALAKSVPPEKEIVRGAVVVNVPPQVEEEDDVTVNPSGKTSEKDKPLKDVVVLGFVTVNVKVLVLFCAIEVGEKLLLSVGAVGRGHPVIVTLSIPKEASGLFEAAPIALILNVVVLAPVDAAV